MRAMLAIIHQLTVLQHTNIVCLVHQTSQVSGGSVTKSMRPAFHGTPTEAPTLRIGARVLLLDHNDQVLLIHTHDPDQPDHHWWGLRA
jgi:hypothetical protein